MVFFTRTRVESAGSANIRGIPIDLLALWSTIVFFSVCASVVLIGIGRIELPVFSLRFSSWSVSRTALIFWLLWKLSIRLKDGAWDWNQRALSTPLFLFAGFVTVSLLPDFDHTGDYRYFLFAFGHYVMVVDVFRGERRQFLLYVMLGITPGVLLARGILADPAILDVSLAARFAFPLDHANTAGYLFSMSIPLCLALVLGGGHWLRLLAVLSVASQLGALILTFSRAAWIASCSALLSISIGEKRLRVMVAVVGAAGLVVLAVSGELRDRLRSVPDAMEDPRVVWRVEVMENAVSVGLDKPILGNGYGRDHLRAALKDKHPAFTAKSFVGHSHNLYAELAAGIGFLGLAAFVWALASAGIQLARNTIMTRQVSDKERYLYLGLLGSLIAFVVAGLGDIPFYHHETRIFFFTLFGLIGLRLESKRSTVNLLS
jgi:O-antigen ligase